MALATTTLSTAIALIDTEIVVASATSVAAGRLIRIDEEWMQIGNSWTTGTTLPVLRGIDGSVTSTHQVTANVVHGLASDFTVSPNQSGEAVSLPAGRPRRVVSYTAAGAIAHPRAGEDMVAIINSTATIAMTVAAPTTALDGCLLWVIGNGKSASTVQFVGGLGDAGSSYDIITLQNAGNVGITAMAIGGWWVCTAAPAITGTTTAIGTAVA